MSALDGLPPDQRAVLELLYGHDRTPEDVAGLAGVPPEAVRARAQEALVALGPERTRAYLRELEGPAEASATAAPLDEAPAAPRRTVPVALVVAACVVVALVALAVVLSTTAGR